MARDVFLPWARSAPAPLPARGPRPLPPPTLPEADRVAPHPEDTVAAAVALDVLRTRSAALSPSPAILTELAAVLLQVGALSGLDDERLAALMAHVTGAVGDKRQRLCAHLAVRARALSPGRRCDPDAVARALREVERGAALLVRDARLLVESRSATTYRQA